MSPTDFSDILSLETPQPWLLLSLALLIIFVVAGRSVTPHALLWLHIARWITVPYLGILSGGLSPTFMGLTHIDWYASLGVGVALFAGILLALAAVRLSLNWASVEGPGPSADARASWADPSGERWGTGVMLVLVNGAEQFHWSFARAAVWEIFLLIPLTLSFSAYWAICLATLVIVPEILLQRLGFLQTVAKLVILVTTAVLFFYTRNFWLCWLLHALSARLLQLSSRSSQQLSA